MVQLNRELKKQRKSYTKKLREVFPIFIHTEIFLIRSLKDKSYEHITV